MVKEVTMETVSIEEAREMAYDGKVIDFDETENGFLCTFLQQVNSAVNKIKAEKKFVICCNTSTGPMYLSKNGTTFYLKDAKSFSEKEAKTKAFFMNKRGSYSWRYVEI